jgi:hypothetical protein
MKGEAERIQGKIGKQGKTGKEITVKRKGEL